MKKKATLSWSGGKDSALALDRILTKGEIEVISLHTIINAETRRVGMHGVREQLIDLQAESLGIQLTKLYTATSDSYDSYENAMKHFFGQTKEQGIDTIVYGDIFLQDLREYREKLLLPFNLAAMYPLWELDTTVVVNEFISRGYKAVLCVVNQDCYGCGLLGKTIDSGFIEQLPTGTDPCGERGEFHTLVYDGPIFNKKVALRGGQIEPKIYEFKVLNSDGKTEVQRSTFWFQDFLPGLVDLENQVS
jgi:uncharacterized protein (TIGR00290 family)